MEQFFRATMDTVRECAEMNETSLEHELTDFFTEYLSQDQDEKPTVFECENLENSKAAYYYKANAYSFSEETGTLDLYVTKFFDQDEISTFYKSDIEKAHNALYRFFMRCIESDEFYIEYRSKDADIAEIIELIYNQYREGNIQDIHFYVMSNGIAARDYSRDTVEITDKNIPFDESIIDIGQIKAMNDSAEGAFVEVLLNDTYQCPLECIGQQIVGDDLNCYIAIMPATILADIYSKHKTKLLDRNVRGFLGKRSKSINEGIYKTLQEDPAAFLSYNNGISSTASSINIVEQDGRRYIHSIKNWQIVNGGQTTTSIYLAKENKVPLSQAFVLMKVSVIGPGYIKGEDMISNIAKCANTQNKVDEADLSSNHKIFKTLSDFSHSEIAPVHSVRKNTHWFFERSRGLYLAEKNNYCNGNLASAKAREFMNRNPKNQIINKTDYAKLEMAWTLSPHISSLGAAKCFKQFWNTYKDKNADFVTNTYFHDLVAKAIIYETADKLFKQAGYKGYGNLVKNYVLALLAARSNGKLDLTYIWEHQEVQDELKPFISQFIEIVYGYIHEKIEELRDPTNEAKKPEFWSVIRTRAVGINIPKSLLLKEEEVNLTDEQIAFINEVMENNTNVWGRLLTWGQSTKKLTILERKRISRLINCIEKESIITYAFAKEVHDLLQKAESFGFN